MCRFDFDSYYDSCIQTYFKNDNHPSLGYPTLEDDIDLYIDHLCSEVYYDPHDTICLFYDSGINRFVDSAFGNVIHDIYRLLTPSQVMLFKKNKESAVYPDITNKFLVELVYPDHLNPEDIKIELIYIKRFS